MAIDSQQIQQLLDAQLPDCEIVVQGDGGKYQVLAVGDVFAGLNAVKRQQKIYQILNPHIATGAIHAVSMRLLTAEERAASV
ncbi:MAG: BolA/IbaG family iron-sulfur metabolism protein [Gammaproteobacteria bacterium]|nr:BolA/IbaG family iron-sulfur metabolism protein [Gammaproteobacteria bacterium]MDP2140212.1 BolA/IbaG family iron-sulfur metabolism protein [Gammaproteobacteria bacterium]MDP2348088.1 BolA/IbaG family iron-sulfur metabolism protein [Gammaproteobacteria bacterium]